MKHSAWLQQAESDLDAASILCEKNMHSQAIWLSSQAVEKAHKAILVAIGLNFQESDFKKMNHNINIVSQLIPDELQSPIDLSISTLLSTLEAQAQNCRYPHMAANMNPPKYIAPSEAIKSSIDSIRAATQLLDWCKTRILRARTANQAMQPTQTD